jgi:CheY-like chemotaxis protein
MGKKILIIDDCDDLRDTLAAILEDAGYSVALASDPDRASKELGKGGLDMVLCDLVMPMPADASSCGDDNESAMVGVYAISEISKKHPKVPVIAISGELTGDALQAISNFGAVGSISKPFKREELLKKVAGVVGQP